MLGVLSVGIVSLSPMLFDMSTIFAAVDPGRERVAIVGSDNDTYLYACKPGPAGETPREQGLKAQAAFEENQEKFLDAAIAELLSADPGGEVGFNAGLSLVLKADSWIGAIGRHLEQEFGCTPLN
ncbi:MAG: hypothetical protein MUE52_16630 [Tabrizicola sp.]|jgi:hypothetical protein|nr:hypothetical protein [Tabrizicola sp.]